MRVTAEEETLRNAVTMHVIAGVGTITSGYGAKLLHKITVGTDPTIHVPSHRIVRDIAHQGTLAKPLCGEECTNGIDSAVYCKVQ